MIATRILTPAIAIVAIWLAAGSQLLAASGPAAPSAIHATAKVVKIYGTGGLAGLEAYQTGVIIDAKGVVLTTNSLVLDRGEVTVVTQLGDRYAGKVLGADPFVDVAVIQIDVGGEPLPAFDLASDVTPESGDVVYVLTNAFGVAAGDEPVSLMQSVVAGIAPLRAQRGRTERIDGGDVLLLDAVTSNPGAAGGAVVDRNGRLVAVVGRELKSRVTGMWMNYALPAGDLRVPIERILQGDASAGADAFAEEPPAVNLVDVYGFAVVAEIVPRTPAYVDYVQPKSIAAEAGLQADDLVLTVNGLVASSTGEFQRLVSSQSDAGKPLDVLVRREGQFVEVSLPPARDRSDDAGPSNSLRRSR